MDQRLGDGRRFLVGGRFSAADMTFAALAAPVLFPTEYRRSTPRLTQLMPRRPRLEARPCQEKR